MPIVATISAHLIINKIENPFPYVRDFKKLNLQELHNSLNRFTQFSFETDDLDTKCEKISSHILSCVNKHIPLRKRTKKELKFAMKPWISRHLRKCISKKDRLYRISRISHYNQSARKRKYNKYKKILEKSIFIAQRRYYSKKVIECQNQSKALWKLINEIT